MIRAKHRDGEQSQKRGVAHLLRWGRVEGEAYKTYADSHKGERVLTDFTITDHP